MLAHPSSLHEQNQEVSLEPSQGNHKRASFARVYQALPEGVQGSHLIQQERVVAPC